MEAYWSLLRVTKKKFFLAVKLTWNWYVCVKLVWWEEHLKCVADVPSIFDADTIIVQKYN